MQVEPMKFTQFSDAWQVSALVSNGHDTWTEIRTFYGVNRKEAEARYYNTVAGMGWTVLE